MKKKELEKLEKDIETQRARLARGRSIRNDINNIESSISSVIMLLESANECVFRFEDSDSDVASAYIVAEDVFSIKDWVKVFKEIREEKVKKLEKEFKEL